MSIHSDRGPALDELPLYRSHREVRAMKIGEVQPNALDGGATLRSADDPRMTVKVDKPYVNLHQPVVGGYYLQLEDRHSYQDGREGFAHAEYFERHYHQVKKEVGYAEGRGRLPSDPVPQDPDKVDTFGHPVDDKWAVDHIPMGEGDPGNAAAAEIAAKDPSVLPQPDDILQPVGPAPLSEHAAHTEASEAPNPAPLAPDAPAQPIP